MGTTTNLRPKTRDRDELLLRRLALPSFGAVPLAAISQRDVRVWVADLNARGLAPATVQKAYQLLGKVMGAAVDAGMLAQSPCRRVPLPKVEREEMRFLTPAEVAALADAIEARYCALVLVGAYGGLRIGELAAYAAAGSTCCGDAIYSAGERDQGAALVELFRERLRPQRGHGTR
ncbi:MAG TPA: hypothetical protein VFN05_05690 [Actinomycetes bacterium]|nr:hypothetical protein [Actinomycetes bacterium]